MARSRRKAGGATGGKFKPKKMGKGYSTNRKVPIGNRPVLRITDVDEDQDGRKSSPSGGKTSGGKTKE